MENCVVSFPEEIGRESEIMKLKPRIEPRYREYEGGVGGWWKQRAALRTLLES